MPSHCSVRSCSDRLKQLLLPCFSFRFTNYSTSNAMSSAWSASTSSAATEHGTGPLLQSTAGANIICSDDGLSAKVCYTNHGGVVVSLGWNTGLYQYICENIPEARELVVDVSAIIPAPPRCQRDRNAYFPDDSVVSQVRGSRWYGEAVDCCNSVLRKHGIVLVACKGGNHRAPTVADGMKHQSRFIVHATLRTRNTIRYEHIAVLVYACVKSSSGDCFYRQLAQELTEKRCTMQLCTGWQADDDVVDERNSSRRTPNAGTVVEVLSVRDCWCSVRAKGTGCTYMLPITWLLPTCVYERRERC